MPPKHRKKKETEDWGKYAYVYHKCNPVNHSIPKYPLTLLPYSAPALCFPSADSGPCHLLLQHCSSLLLGLSSSNVFPSNPFSTSSPGDLAETENGPQFCSAQSPPLALHHRIKPELFTMTCKALHRILCLAFQTFLPSCFVVSSIWNAFSALFCWEKSVNSFRLSLTIP